MNFKFLHFFLLLFYIGNIFSQDEDSTAPVINSVTISPNPATNGDSVTVTVNATDDSSGIQYINLTLVNPEGGQPLYTYTSIENWEKLGDNEYSQDLTLPEWAVSGEWYVQSISIADNANNNYYQSSFSEEIATFTVESSTPDATSPELNSISITPNPVNNGDYITVSINTTDDISGTAEINISLSSPNGEQNEYIYDSIENWKDLGNDSYSKEIQISEWAIGGEWYVSSVSINDNAENSFYKNSYEEEIATFTVESSTPDASAPEFN